MQRKELKDFNTLFKCLILNPLKQSSKICREKLTWGLKQGKHSSYHNSEAGKVLPATAKNNN